MHSPKCGSDNKVKSGKVNPRQRYKCKECGCNETQSYKHGYRLDKKLLALPFYLQGNGYEVQGAY
jgi:transposase-like protein